MSTPRDPLWSPEQPGDPELVRLERLLGRYRHVLSGVPMPAAPPRRRWIRALAIAGGAIAAAALTVAVWLPWRLHWTADAPWPVSADVPAPTPALAVGDTLQTGAGQHARVAIARIGALEVSPQTRLSLIETRSGHHRIALETGHVHARVWAPPGAFGVLDGGAEVIDLGCVFDLWKHADGSGRLAVGSGWVMHSEGGRETLVPAGYALDFGPDHVGLPLRPAAPSAFADAVTALDRMLYEGHRDADLETRSADLATADDAFTLLSLLTRYPALADGPLYPRLAETIDAPPLDARHREAWASGSVHAINAWWDRMPRPPKQWWRNWRDVVL
ncbi:MAG: hypothetical protein DI564_01690 [Rhodanobacter denitrificans]|uniref:FecR protein domain-containing protein n=1 Tax=Rhodanobacter denitrificans TaxID=666685 RepID=A0A2W5KTX8_9GAMM|nr:MAG: hypothetical protein DI564_01690 [Rhodanobacter denitrificans]